MDRFRSASLSRAPEFSPAPSKDSPGGADEGGYSLFGRKLSLRSMRAAARSLSEISFTDGVFGEIASAQVGGSWELYGLRLGSGAGGRGQRAREVGGAEIKTRTMEIFGGG